MNDRRKSCCNNSPVAFKILGRREGSVSVLGLFWAGLLISLATFLLHLQKATEREIQQRAEAYLCFKKQLFGELRFLKRMARLNKVIQGGRLLMLTPKSFLAGKAMVQGAKRGQQLLNTQYHFSLKKCPALKKWPSLPSSPLGFPLRRDALGLALLRRKQWKLIVPQKWGGRPFQLEAHFQAPHRRISEVSLHYRERPLRGVRGLLWWRPSFGVWPSFSSLWL